MENPIFKEKKSDCSFLWIKMAETWGENKQIGQIALMATPFTSHFKLYNYDFGKIV